MILAPTLSLSAGSGAAIVRPTFSRDFAGEKTLDNGTGPGITFTRASTATYFDADGVLQSAAIDEPRFDHAGGSSLGLLIEEQRTNIATHSADWNNAAWTKTNVSVSSNTDLAPDGTTTADTVEDTTTGSTDNLITISVAAAAANAETFTWSFFIKKTTGAANYPAARLLFSGGTAIQAYAVIDTNSGTITTTGGSVVSFTASVQSVGLYWRVSCTGTNTSTGNTTVAGRLHPAYNLDGTASQDTNATGSVVVWGAQLEKGAFPTSYIPTTSAAVTRSVDLASVDPISSFYNAGEGALFAEFSRYQTQGVANFLQFSGASPSQIALETNATPPGTMQRFMVETGAGAQATISFVGATANTVFRLVGAYAANSFQAAQNGTLGTEDSSGALPTVSQMNVGFGKYDTGGIFKVLNGHIRKIAYYPKRLTNALLEQLTT